MHEAADYLDKMANQTLEHARPWKCIGALPLLGQALVSAQLAPFHGQNLEAAPCRCFILLNQPSFQHWSRAVCMQSKCKQDDSVRLKLK